jgi:hypothetical protein
VSVPSVLVILLAVVLQAPAQPTFTITLDSQSGRCPNDGQGGLVQGAGGSGTNHGEPKTEPPLEVTLVNMNLDEYRVGDPLQFAVSIKNRSQTPQRIPTLSRSAICNELDPKKAERADAKMILRVNPPSGRPGFVSVDTLWASPKQKGSWAILEPGQTALIRVSKEWSTLYFPGGVPDRGEVFVEIERVGGMTVESTNRIPIRLVR